MSTLSRKVPRTWRKKSSHLRMRIATTVYRRLVYLVYPLGQPMRVIGCKLELDIAELRREQLEEYLRFRTDQNAAQIETRFSRDDRCFVCRRENEIVDAGWIATGRASIPYLNADMHLSLGDVYNYDSFTSPEFQGRFIYMQRNRYIAETNLKEGFKRSVALVAPENKTPLTVLKKNGLEPQGMYSYLRLGITERWWRQAWGEEALPMLLAKNGPCWSELTDVTQGTSTQSSV